MQNKTSRGAIPCNLYPENILTTIRPWIRIAALYSGQQPHMHSAFVDLSLRSDKSSITHGVR